MVEGWRKGVEEWWRGGGRVLKSGGEVVEGWCEMLMSHLGSRS